MNARAEKILIKSTNWIGDVVISLPAVKAIRKIYPDSSITILCKSYLEEIYKNLGFIDNVTCMDNNSPKAFFHMIKEIRSGGYDLGILLQNAINGALLFYFGNVKKRVGYPTDARGIFLTDKPKDKYGNSHQMHRYMGLAKYLGYQGAEPGPYIPTPLDDHIGDKVFLYRFISKRLERNITVRKHTIGIAPGAKYGPAKMWGEGNFRNLISLLLKIRDINIIMIGSREDYQLSEKIREPFSENPHVINSSGYFSLIESLYIIGELDLLVSNDSGAMHMASARDTNIAAIFGPTVFSHTSPISQKATIFFKKVDCWPCRFRKCPRKTHKCMDQIKPEEVYDNILQRLGL